MNYHERLTLFLMYADRYGLIIVSEKYKPNDSCREWAN